MHTAYFSMYDQRGNSHVTSFLCLGKGKGGDLYFARRGDIYIPILDEGFGILKD